MGKNQTHEGGGGVIPGILSPSDRSYSDCIHWRSERTATRAVAATLPGEAVLSPKWETSSQLHCQPRSSTISPTPGVLVFPVLFDIDKDIGTSLQPGGVWGLLTTTESWA